MRERRYVKFKVDIYDDTKTKIIDQRPERDFIHYFFARSIILAGKADCEGDLYMAKNIPYTIETLATEFNRDAALIKLALDLLIELKMIEVTEDNVYRVKSFVKHQNIKVKEKVEINDKEETNAVAASNVINKENENNGLEFENYKTKNEIDIKKSCNPDHIMKTDIARVTTDVGKINAEEDNLAVLEMNDNNKSKRKKKSESDLGTELAVDEIEEEQPILVFFDGDMPPLEEGERLIWGQSLV